MKYALIFFIFVTSNVFCLSFDQKVDLDKDVLNISSFDEAKLKGVIEGNFYGIGSERYFENLKLTGKFSRECMIKGYIVGYQDVNNPLFINSLPLASANEFQDMLSSLNYMFSISISLVFEFSENCKIYENFPDVIVIQNHI